MKKEVPYTVGLVLDPQFGEKLVSLNSQIHVWIVDTPANQNIIQQIWAKHSTPSIERGITTFKVLPESSAEERCLGILSSIDLHHGEYSHNPPYSILEVIGLHFKDELKSRFIELGFDRFELTNEGFRAIKSNKP